MVNQWKIGKGHEYIKNINFSQIYEKMLNPHPKKDVQIHGTIIF